MTSRITGAGTTGTSSQIKLHLRSKVREFENHLDHVAAHPSPEAIHKLRVVSRKIRTILWLIKRDKQLPSFRPLSRDLRELGGLLGKVREIDVTQRLLKASDPDFSGLHSGRRQSMAELRRYLDVQRRARLRASLNRALRIVGSRSTLRTEKSFGKLAKLAKAWAGCPRLGKRALHEFRIDLKRIRYALEAVHGPAKNLRHLQDLLGQAHDLDVIPGRLRNKAIRTERKRVQKEANKRAPSDMKTALRYLRCYSENRACPPTRP